MKKYLSIIIAFVLLFSLVGCSDNSFSRKGVDVVKDITDYAVISNGGSAVQYGEYIYFINGYRGYADESGTENRMGEVIKGGLYRTKLIDPRGIGGKTQRDYNFHYGQAQLNVFIPSVDPVSFLQFDYYDYEVVDAYELDEDGEFALDDNDEKIPLLKHTAYGANAQLITPKTVGTSGYKDGGIFIYDEYIFFASPNNNKNREGDVQYKKTDFYVSTLSGSKTRRLYTTKNDAEASAYAFYKYGGNYYLVVQDGSDIVSVCMSGKGKIEGAKTIAKDVSSVLFPKKDIYYKSMFENSADDFIYYTRAATKNDNITVGQVMEMMRPNGTQGLILSNDGGSVSLLNTDNGLLFYEVGNVITNKSVKYSNFHNLLMAKNSAYKKSHENSDVNLVDVTGSLAIDTSSYSSVRGAYPNPLSINDVYVITFGDNAVNTHSANGAKTIFSGTATFVKLVQNRLYLISSDALQSVDFYDGGKTTIIVSDATAAPTYMFDILDDYVVYMGDEDDYLKECAKFKRLDDEGLESLFIGERTEDEQVPEE